MEDNETFMSDEAYSFWEKNLRDKGFIGERGFSTFISLFVEIIETRGWNLFCKHKPSSCAAVVREFYSNIIDMKEDAVDPQFCPSTLAFILWVSHSPIVLI